MKLDEFFKIEAIIIDLKNRSSKSKVVILIVLFFKYFSVGKPSVRLKFLIENLIYFFCTNVLCLKYVILINGSSCYENGSSCGEYRYTSLHTLYEKLWTHQSWMSQKCQTTIRRKGIWNLIKFIWFHLRLTFNFRFMISSFFSSFLPSWPYNYVNIHFLQ